MSENSNRSNRKYIVMGSLIAFALVAGVAVTLGMSATGAPAAEKHIVITDENMPPTPQIEMQVFKLVNLQQVPRPDDGIFPIAAGTDHTFNVILVSHDSSDFDPVLRVYNANDTTAESRAFLRVASTEADRGFPPGLTVSTIPSDQMALKANTQVPVTVVVHTTPELESGTYQIAVAIIIDQEIEGEPVVAHVQGEIITIEVA